MSKHPLPRSPRLSRSPQSPRLSRSPRSPRLSRSPRSPLLPPPPPNTSPSPSPSPSSSSSTHQQHPPSSRLSILANRTDRIPVFNYLLLSNFLANASYAALYTTLPLHLLHNQHPTPTTLFTENILIFNLGICFALFSLPSLLLYIIRSITHKPLSHYHYHQQSSDKEIPKTMTNTKVHLPLSLLLEGLGTLVLSPSSISLSWFWIALARFIQGLGAAGFQIASVEMIMFYCWCGGGDDDDDGDEESWKEEAGVYMGVLETAALVGAAAGPVAVVVLGSFIGKDGIPWVYAALGLAVCTVAGLVKKVIDGQEESCRDNSAEMGHKVNGVFREEVNGVFKEEVNGVENGFGKNSDHHNDGDSDDDDGKAIDVVVGSIGKDINRSKKCINDDKGVWHLFQFYWVWVISSMTVTAMISFTFLRPGLAVFLFARGTYTPIHIATIFTVRPAAYLFASAIAAMVGAEGNKYSTRPMVTIGLLIVSASYHFLADANVGFFAVIGVTLGATLAFVPTMNDICRITNIDHWGHWEYVSLLCATLFALGEFAGPLLAGILTFTLGSFQYASRACCLLTLIVAILFAFASFVEMFKTNVPNPYHNAMARRISQTTRQNVHADETQPLLS